MDIHPGQTLVPGHLQKGVQVLDVGVDAAEFVVNKLLDRGSLSATTMVTNVQDFIGKVATGLGVI